MPSWWSLNSGVAVAVVGLVVVGQHQHLELVVAVVVVAQGFLKPIAQANLHLQSLSLSVQVGQVLLPKL
jgi:hypothetical protein